MLAHSFDRFYMVTKFILPSIGDLNFSALTYDNTCRYLDNKNIHDTDPKKHMLDLMTFCKKIQHLILPQIPRKQKHGIITMLVSSFIGIAYEGISSFLHHK